MTAAPTHATARRIPVALAIVAALVMGACRDAADGPTRAGAAGATDDSRDMAAAGEVVIAAPRGGYAAAPVAGGGTVTGTVSSSTPLSAGAPAATGRDSAVCGASVADGSVAPGTGLGNAVVWLDGVRKGKPVSLEKRIELESDRCVLVPRVQAAFVGGAVNVIGHDPFRQHLRFLAAGDKAPRARVLLGKDEQVIPTELPLKAPGLVIVNDADHPWPRAYIAVFDHPYFAVTKPDGTFAIDQVPAGSYTLYAWHERTGRTEQKVTVGASGAVKVDVKLEGR